MIPGLDVLRSSRRAWLPGDLLAGVTIARADGVMGSRRIFANTIK